MRGTCRAQASRDVRDARNWKMIMIESPSDALHAPGRAAWISANKQQKRKKARQARSGGARGYARG
ncbi:hypothetical protein DB771_08140 [Burkholderia sp. AU29985]|nr:hypothetical protein EGY28_03300 [Burkholderia dolosa]PRE43304.1 hypothetical protein C6P87_25090 [Burkholderia sp. AU12872]PUA77381.1 hypothetical protein DB771_08140 [Burkholderia sp. AU29985]